VPNNLIMLSRSTLLSTVLPQWQTDRLAVLLAALEGVPISDAERRTLTWLAGFELHTVGTVAALITRARGTHPDSQARSTDRIGHEGV
jgi:hypothetical protein